jgi:transforming growth factor-beta-induced protein
MTDHVEPPSQDEDDDKGLPLFWGLILVTVVSLIAVWLFGRFDVDGADAFSTTSSTSAEQPETTSTTQAPVEALNLVDVLAADGRFTTLLGLLEGAGLMAELEGSGPFTLFAPTDEALEGVDAGEGDALTALLLRHVAAGRLADTDLFPGSDMLEMLSGETVALTADPDPSIGGAAIIEANLDASNGLIHVVAAPLAASSADPGETLASDGRFATLLAAVAAAGLDDALTGDVTVLAPTDEAFAALPAGVVDQLLADTDRLGSLLGYHVVSGSVDGTGSYTTAIGEEVAVGESDVNGVVIADRPASNVVALDGVLVPPGFVLADVNDILDLAAITFEVGSAVITADGQAELDRAAEYLVANPVAVEIGGHTDADGSEESNLVLSEQRAQSVVDYLIAAGVDPGLLSAVGYGEALPIADNDTDEGRAQNRRIEFSILG